MFLESRLIFMVFSSLCYNVSCTFNTQFEYFLNLAHEVNQKNLLHVIRLIKD